MGIDISEEGVRFINTTDDFKETVTQKFLSRGDRTAKEIAEESGVTVKTLYNWSDEYAKDQPMKKKQWTTFEKMKLVIEYESLGEESRGEFLRKHGLFEETLQKWRKAVLDGSIEKFTEGIARKHLSETKKELEKAQKELRRKEKALAEAAALLILKKKAEALWGEDEE